MKGCNDSLEKVKAYYQLTKPGIIRGNVMTAIAGFLFAAQGTISFSLLFWLIIGVVGVIASGCVFNNYIDRHIDKKMSRTKHRALVVGSINTESALMFGAILGVIGLTVLLLFVNVLTAVIGLVAFVAYVGIYGYAKRKTVYGTLVGSLPGALSLVAGYTAVANHLDVTAFILFLIMALWQMPHFYAIAIYRIKDYASAGLPILSIKKGVKTTKVHIVAYIILFGIACTLLSVYGHAGATYLVGISLMSLGWLWLALNGFKAKKVDAWAKSVFGFSLVTLLVFSVLISVDNLLP